MSPSRSLVIDNRPVAPVFLDGSPLSDGVAQFASSIINAPIAADRTRRQREAQELATLWATQDRQTAAEDRSRRIEQDELAQLWATQDRDRAAQDRQIAQALAGVFNPGPVRPPMAPTPAQNAWTMGAEDRKRQADERNRKELLGLWKIAAGGKGGARAPAADKPIVEDFGSMGSPNKRQWDPVAGKWVEPPMAGPADPEVEKAIQEALIVFHQGDGSWWGSDGKGDISRLQAFPVDQVQAVAAKYGIPLPGAAPAAPAGGQAVTGAPAAPIKPIPGLETGAAPAGSSVAAVAAPAATNGQAVRFARDAQGLLRIPTPAGGTLGVTDQEWAVLQGDTPERAAMIREWSQRLTPQQMAVIKQALKAQGIR